MKFPGNQGVLPLLLIVAAVYPLNATAQAPAAPTAAPPATNLVSEAEAFMADYADELRRGDRVALAARYDAAGVHELRPGVVHRSTHEAVALHYNTDWKPPSSFEWRDLTYDVVGPEAVVVSGLFAWARVSGGTPEIQSYSALLRRQPNGRLGIRLEAEAGVPAVPWSILAVSGALIALAAGAIGLMAGRRRTKRQISRLAPPGASAS